VQANGSFIYTPNAGFIGTDVFTYTLSDGLSTTAPISVEIEVENQAPGGWDDSLSLHAGTTATGNVLVNDRDADGDALTASLVTDVQHGSLTLGSDGAFTYTPTASYVGSDSFVYKASDGLADSSSVTVTLSVTNTAPSAYDDRFVVTHDAVLNDTTVSNDRDWDGDSLTASLITAPTNGQLTLNADGTFAFTPDAGFTGSDSFQYRLADSWANGNTATATIQVTNQSPVALDELVTLFRGEEYVVSTTDLLANDSDGDGDSLTVTLVDLPQEGTFASNPDGTWTYTPDGDFAGTDTLTYRVNDGIEDSTLATVTIDVLNREPSAADDSFDVVHDQSIAAGAVSIFDNDIDLDGDSLSAELVTGTSYGSLTLNADGTFAYTANAGFVGQDEFRYRVTDGIAHSEPVVVPINIDNSEPVAVEDRLRVIHDQTLTVPVESGLISSAIDADGDSLTVTVLAQPLSGQLNVAADGSFTYEPDAGFAGTDSFIYRVSDGVSDSPAALVTIDVQNTPVSVAGDVIAVEPDQATVTFLATDLLENDVDFEGDSLTVALVTPPPRGTLTLSGNTFTYTRDGSYSGDVAFTYSVSDGVSTSYGTAVLMFSGTLSGGAATGTGADPIAGDDLYTVDRNGILDVGYAGGLLRNDFDPNGDDLSTVQENGPANGTLTLTGDGEFVYTPNLGFVGTDSFTYHVTDGTESSPGVARISNSATVSITVTNTAPTAGAKTYTTHHGVELSSANDGLDHVVSDAEGDTLTFSLVSDVSDGTLTFNAGGSFDYTPDAGFVGTDSFTYKVSDGALESGTATVTIDVTNTIPVARTQYYRGHQGEAITVPASGVLTLASDFDADVLTAVLESGPASGTLTLNSDGSFTYTPNAGFVGADTFRFRANDGAEDSSPATVTLDVRNEAPDALDSSHSVHQGDTLTIDPRAWDADADDLEFEILTTPSSGTLTYDTISGTNPRTLGPLTYEVPNAVVTDTLTFRAWDGAEWSAPATVTIDVTNIRPDAIPATRVIRPNDSVGISLLPVYASDADGDDITVVSPGTVTTALGQYTLTANGTFTFDSNGTVGDEIVPFSVTDLAEVSDPQNITVRVVNTPPVALDHIYHFHHADHPEIWMTNEGPYAIDLATGPRAAHDADSDPLTFELVATSNGTATLTPDGQLFFTPPFEGFIGTVSIQYRVNDGYTDSPTGTVTLEFTNNAPVSLDDYLTTPHGQSLVITQDDLTNNDRDVNVDQLDWDVDVSSLTVVSTVTGAGPGTLTPNLDSNGVLLSYSYSPPVDPDFVG
ncbi:MAG: Ig-like domain-containing protein, partial [Boseongicola sp.]|nr:Ig-like domain-containing protein [Boseongicola sp.]